MQKPLYNLIGTLVYRLFLVICTFTEKAFKGFYTNLKITISFTEKFSLPFFFLSRSSPQGQHKPNARDRSSHNCLGCSCLVSGGGCFHLTLESPAEPKSDAISMHCCKTANKIRTGCQGFIGQAQWAFTDIKHPSESRGGCPSGGGN